MTKKNEDLENGYVLPIMEHFYTIQGEGYHSGLASYFIRIGGCDVGCHWCDVKESWLADRHPLLSVDDLLRQIPKKIKSVIITGGEPLMWNLDYLTMQLKKKGYSTHLETSGAYKVSGDWDWFCLSPKKRSLPLEENYLLANELKVIVYNSDDFRFCEQQAENVSKHCLLFLQPEWSKRDEMMPKIVDYVLENPRWKSSVQAHKYMNIP